jgi:FtsP/CotA-like multicopper oxidase with cupredoxin domain
MPSTSLIPHVAKDVSSPVWDEPENVSLNFSTGVFRWELNTTSMRVSWEDPSLLQIYNNQTNFTDSSGVIELPYQDEWVYLMINTTVGVTHPIHLHGHDFYVLAQGSGLWNGSLTTTNPPRRDTAMLPKNGHLLVHG